MFTLLKRWVVYLLTPAGLVLLFFPLNTHYNTQIDKDVVYLGVIEKLIEPNPVPRLESGVEDLQLFLEEQQRVRSLLSSPDAAVTNPHGFPIIGKADLQSYPALYSLIGDMLQQATPVLLPPGFQLREQDSLPPEEWERFRSVFLPEAETFQYGNLLFKGAIQSKSITTPVEIEGLKTATKAAGGICLLLSLFAWRGLYSRPSIGIQVGTPRAMMIWDVITLIVGLFFAFVVIDFALTETFDTESFWGNDEEILFLGVFWLLVGNLVVAAWATATAVQSVSITAEGISTNSLFGEKSLSWAEIDHIMLGEYHSPRLVGDVYTPRKLAKIVKVVGQESNLRILEPPMAETKQEIISLLKAFAPDRLQPNIADTARAWESIW